ncbi:MAG: hypothetical protein ACFB4J_12380 [Elainellaceae cyanobacterium]
MSQIPTIPDNVSFSDAIALTRQLLDHVGVSEKDDHLEAGDEAAIAQAIAALVQTKAGARGFFVAYLTGEPAPASPPHPGVISGLKLAPEQTVDLLTKNLAMSTAMVLTHNRQNNSEMARQSSLVQSRSLDLIEVLKMPTLRQALTQLRDSAAATDEAQASNHVTDRGYEAFLTQWNYDNEQRQHIKVAADEALERLG